MQHTVSHMYFKAPAGGPMHRHKSALLLSGVSSLALVLGNPALAQEAASAEQAPIEEILVTGTKRGAQRLQDVPGSIRALTRADLESRDIEEFEDYVRLVPGVTFRDLGPGEKTIVTRGLVSTGASTTALYFDEANITAFNDGEGGGRNVDFKLFDLERIEVLRGPQGTIYGASALGGTIRIIPAKPNLQEWTGGLEAELSDTRAGSENWEVNGHLDMPIVQDKLGLRVTGWYVDRSGYIDNIRLDRKDINDEETIGGRAILRYQATPDFTLTAMAMFQDQEIGDGSRFNRIGDTAPLFPGEDPVTVNDKFQVTDFTQNPRNDEAAIYSLTADYDFEWGNIVATSNFYDRELIFNFDSTPILLFFGVPIRAISSFPEDRELWSNEIRFSSNFNSPFQILGGFFYQEEDIESSSNVFTVDEDGAINEPTPSVLQVVRDRSIDQIAVFGEVSYAFTDRLKATIGARFADFDFVTDENALVPFFGPPMGPEPTKRGDDDSFILKFNAEYSITEDHLVYATASEGFRRGGLNLNAFGELFEIPETFNSDTLWNIEGGAKTSWFDGLLTVNATFFAIFWSDIQVETSNDENTAEFFTNAGKARVDGLELEIFSEPLPGLDIVASLGWQDARLTEDQPPVGDPDSPSRGLAGDEINNVPDFTASFSGMYTHPLTSALDGSLRLEVEYTGSSDTRIAGDRDPFNVKLDEGVIVDMRAGIETENWRLTAYAENLFDENAPNDAINEVTNILAFFTTRPRTVGLQAGYRF